MEIVKLEEEFPLTIGLPRTTYKPHVGEIIHRMLVDMGLEKRSNPPNPYQFEKGFVWERLLSLALPEVADRPGELELDGIILSPDGVGWRDDVGDVVVEEYKCTARSSNSTPSDNLAWMMQVKAYCKVVGTRYVVFRILHLNGDYKADRSPTPAIWRIEFTQDELDANWKAIVEYAVGRGLI